MKTAACGPRTSANMRKVPESRAFGAAKPRPDSRAMRLALASCHKEAVWDKKHGMSAKFTAERWSQKIAARIRLPKDTDEFSPLAQKVLLNIVLRHGAATLPRDYMAIPKGARDEFTQVITDSIVNSVLAIVGQVHGIPEAGICTSVSAGFAARAKLSIKNFQSLVYEVPLAKEEMWKEASFSAAFFVK